jgi:hypothetical protein
MRLFLSLFLLWMNPDPVNASERSGFSCAATPPGRRVTKPASCDDTHGFGLLTAKELARPELAALFKGKTEKDIEQDPGLKDLALEAKFRTTSNMNGARFRFPSGVERSVFRGSYLAPEFSPTSVVKRQPGEKRDPRSECMRELVQEHALFKIVNYDELDWPSAKRLTDEERDSFLKWNPKGSYWKFVDSEKRTFQYKFSKARGKTEAERRETVFQDIIRIVREIEGSPGDPGSVYIHCYGGHHRTGVVYGVLQKCLGKISVEDAIREYRCHIGYESEQNPGGRHPDNETVIRDFPCARLFN